MAAIKFKTVTDIKAGALTNVIIAGFIYWDNDND